MTDTERFALLGCGLLAVIAYELYRPARPGVARYTSAAMPGQTPTWLRQLSETEQDEFSRPAPVAAEWWPSSLEFSTAGMSEEITNNLLSVPQGPGGLPQGPLIQENFFSPTRGIFANCE